jgi:TetR/AcrR family transcriptional regulator
MVRVLVGDALIYEQPRLMARVSLLFDKLESILRGHWRSSALAANEGAPTAEAQMRAGLLLMCLRGRLHAFVRSDWKQRPTDGASEELAFLIA